MYKKERKTVKEYEKSPYLKASYYDDMAIRAFETPFRKKALGFGLALWIVFPFLAPSFFLHITNLIAIAAIGAVALNLLIGNVGLLSLGHAGFMAAGAFTTAIMASKLGMPIWVVVPVSIIVGCVLGFVAGLPSLQLKGIYLGLSTLAMHHIICYACSEYQFHGGFGYGIVIDDPSIGSLMLSGKKTWYFVLWIILMVTALFVVNLLRSKPGRAWVAIRDRDIAAEVAGIHIGYYKILAFVFSSGVTAMAGCLYAYYTAVVSVEEYRFPLTISYLAMIIVGGVGSVLGSIIGASVIVVLPFLLMYAIGSFDVSLPVKEYFSVIQAGILGCVIIAFLLVEPLGLAEIWRRFRMYFELWPFKYKPLSVTKR